MANKQAASVQVRRRQEPRPPAVPRKLVMEFLPRGNKRLCDNFIDDSGRFDAGEADIQALIAE